jgi:hypothetical protein
LDPSNIGERMTGTELGEDTWRLPLGASVTKVVPIKDADHG